MFAPGYMAWRGELSDAVPPPRDLKSLYQIAFLEEAMFRDGW